MTDLHRCPVRMELARHALHALNVPVSSTNAEADHALLSTAITNWCVLAGSLSDKFIKELCSAAWKGDLYVNLKTMTISNSLQVCNT